MFDRYASAKMLFEEAEKRGLQPAWKTPDGLFSFEQNGKTLFVYYAKLHINSQLGAWICEDKHLTRTFLETEKFPTIDWCYSKKTSEINAFFDRHHPIIQKPVLGMKSAGVRLINERSEIDISNPEDCIFEKFMEGIEHRCFVLKGKVIGVQRKDLDPTETHPWKKRCTNLERSEWDTQMTSDALAIADALRMGCIAVDFIVDSKGTARVLELNGMPAFHFFHEPHAGKPILIAPLLFDAILSS